MKNIRHPNFILALVSSFFMLMGTAMRSYGYSGGDYVLGLAISLGAIHWIWAVIDVIRRDDMKSFQKRFWLIAVIACPILGAMIFYALHQERDKLVT